MAEDVIQHHSERTGHFMKNQGFKLKPHPRKTFINTAKWKRYISGILSLYSLTSPNTEVNFFARGCTAFSKHQLPGFFLIHQELYTFFCHQKKAFLISSWNHRTVHQFITSGPENRSPRRSWALELFSLDWFDFCCSTENHRHQSQDYPWYKHPDLDQCQGFGIN